MELRRGRLSVRTLHCDYKKEKNQRCLVVFGCVRICLGEKLKRGEKEST